MITDDDVLVALESAVGEYGEDWVATESMNFYVRDGAPRMCMAALALTYLGLPQGAMERHPCLGVFSLLEEYPDFAIEENAKYILRQAQDLQDNETPWGEAMQEVHLMMKELEEEYT